MSNQLPHIHEALVVIRSKNQKAWYNRTEAYQRAILRGVRKELVNLLNRGYDQQNPWILEVQDCFSNLLGWARSDVNHEFQPPTKDAVKSVFDAMRSFMRNGFQRWAALNHDQRQNGLQHWRNFLESLIIGAFNETNQLGPWLKALGGKHQSLLQEEKKAVNLVAGRAQEDTVNSTDERDRAMQEMQGMFDSATDLEWGEHFYKYHQVWSDKSLAFRTRFLQCLEKSYQDGEEEEMRRDLFRVLSHRSPVTAQQIQDGTKASKQFQPDKQTAYWPTASWVQPLLPAGINTNIQYRKFVHQSWRTTLTRL